MRADEVSARIGALWPDVLARLGIAREFLVKRHGPCPACGGKDRYRFDNRSGRGDFFCSGCGPGDGFALLMRVHGWDFRTAFARVMDAADLRHTATVTPVRSLPTPACNPESARPTERVLRLWRESCEVCDCADAIEYLASRRLWPLPTGCTLRAHLSTEYFEGGQRVGRFAALVGDVRDEAGDLVTVHVTYLHKGRKLAERESRKILSPLTGRTGCAIRLQRPCGDSLGIGEGIETCLAAAALHGIPTWSALNTSLLAKFEPPPGIKRLMVFADRDIPGLDAAARLMVRLQGKVTLEVRTPVPPAGDWADVLAARYQEAA
jgi:putative DNA primase/helicase